jgi:hypothetical protein
MAKVLDWFRAARPDCATTTIHWESWEGSGMATLPRYAWGPKTVMNMKYMSPEEGVCRLEQELQAGLPAAEVLYTFGDFYPTFYPREQQALGEFVPGARAPVESGSPPAPATCPLLQNVVIGEDEATGDTPLDPQADAFLIEHRLRDKPLLPVVVGLEALAESAMALFRRPVIGFGDVQMVDGLSFHTDRMLVARVRAKRTSDNQAAGELTCDFANRAGKLVQQDRPYLRGCVELGERDRIHAVDLPPIPTQWTPFAYPDGSMVYHGPAFRGLVGTNFGPQGGWGRISALPLADLVGSQRAGDWFVPSCVLDNALYACGVHLWTHGQGAISLPRSIGRLRFGRAPRDGETCYVSFVCHKIDAAEAVYDFTVVGQDRSVILRAEEYRKIILARGGPS